eukprot:tig00000073_g1716.t1
MPYEVSDAAVVDSHAIVLFPSRSGTPVNETIVRSGGAGEMRLVTGLTPGVQYTLYLVLANAAGTASSSIQFTTPLVEEPASTPVGCFNASSVIDDFEVVGLGIMGSAPLPLSNCAHTARTRGYRYFGETAARPETSYITCFASNSLASLTAGGASSCYSGSAMQVTSQVVGPCNVNFQGSLPALVGYRQATSLCVQYPFAVTDVEAASCGMH